MKKKYLLLLVAAGAMAGLAGCGNKNEEEDYKIAVVTDVGQLNDGGFNQGTYEGAKAFADANGYKCKYYQPAGGENATDNDRVAAMRQAIEGGAEVIVTPGFLQANAITEVAEANPDVKFVFVDGWAIGKANVTAISYKEQESGYFAGYAAVKDGYRELGGTFGGGATNAACNRFCYGYLQGIEAAAKELDAHVNVKYSFKYGSGFSASPELKTQIAGWYQTGTEVVFACGGSMLQSVKAAAEEDNTGAKKIIGVDVDQAGESERVITSAVKGLAPSVMKVLGEWKDGKWDEKLADKLSNLGASDNATGLPTAEGSWRFQNFTVEEYNELFAKVVAGTLQIKDNVGDDMSTKAAWDAICGDYTNATLTFEA